ncbi:hypothetical protein [Paenibacillus pini]|uniref:hypothetical protein n=1 Tax=Paenibacillus pini TaxID=669461 RepID=UPI000562366C|nr:hypothetical protein [Paenibacillus pini]
MKKVIRRDFPKYKRIQVGGTITKVDSSIKELIEENKILGITYRRKYKYTNKTFYLNKYRIVYTDDYFSQVNRHQIFVAVDQNNQKVYWNYTSLPDKRSYD